MSKASISKKLAKHKRKIAKPQENHFFKPSEKIPFDVQMGKPIAAGGEDGMEVHEARGNHFDMISPAKTPALVKKMKECIETQFSE